MAGYNLETEFQKPLYFQYDDFKLPEDENLDTLHTNANAVLAKWYKESYSPTTERALTVLGVLGLGTAVSLGIGVTAGVGVLATRLIGYTFSRLTFVSLTALKIGALAGVVALVGSLAMLYLKPNYVKNKKEMLAEEGFLTCVKKGNLEGAYQNFHNLSPTKRYDFSDILGLLNWNHRLWGIKHLFFTNVALGVVGDAKAVKIHAQKQEYVDYALLESDDPKLSDQFLKKYPKIDHLYREWNKVAFLCAEKTDLFVAAFGNSNRSVTAGYKVWKTQDDRLVLSDDPVIGFGEQFLKKNFDVLNSNGIKGKNGLENNTELPDGWNQKAFDDYKETIKVVAQVTLNEVK